MTVKTSDLKWYGRYSDIDGIRYFDYSASGFEFCFTGKKAVATILSDPELFDDNTKGVFGLYVSELSSEADYKGASFWENFPESLTKRFVLLEKENVCTLFESQEEKTVLIKVLKLSEVNFGCAGLKSLEVEGKLIAPSKEPAGQSLEVIGDSITCGYGIEGVFEKDVFTTRQQRPDLAYAFLTAKTLGLEFNLVSWSGIGIISKYVDASVEVPDTTVVMPSVWPYVDKSLSLRRGLEPVVWDEARFSPDIVVLHLGTNDASFVRNHEDRRLSYVCGLRQFLEAIHRRSPKAKICCCLGVMGQDLCASVEEALKQFSGDFKNVPVKYVKFPVQLDADGIGADWHPSAKTHEKIAKILSDALKEWV
jgi:lysophospholipase L1-like esterase